MSYGTEPPDWLPDRHKTFVFFSNNFGLTLLESEINDIQNLFNLSKIAEQRDDYLEAIKLINGGSITGENIYNFTESVINKEY